MNGKSVIKRNNWAWKHKSLLCSPKGERLVATWSICPHFLVWSPRPKQLVFKLLTWMEKCSAHEPKLLHNFWLTALYFFLDRRYYLSYWLETAQVDKSQSGEVQCTENITLCWTIFEFVLGNFFILGFSCPILFKLLTWNFTVQ